MSRMAYQQPRHRHGRAHVRHQLFRARERARRMYRKYWRGIREGEEDETDRVFHRKWIYQFAMDRKPCSCWMCGHTREREGPTLQEVRMAMAERQEDHDIENPWYGTRDYYDSGPDGWRDHPFFVDPMRGVPECGMGAG